MERVTLTIPDSLRQSLDEEANKATENRSECVRRAVQERIERLRQGRFERLLAEAYQLSNEDPATDLQPAWTGPLPAARRAGPPTTGS